MCVSNTTCVQHTPIQETIINKQNPHTDDENVYKKCVQKNVHTTKVYAENGLQQKENNKKYTTET